MAYETFSLFSLDTRMLNVQKKIVHSKTYVEYFHQPSLLLCAMAEAWSEVVGFFSSIRQWVIFFFILSMEAAEKSEMQKWTDRWVQERLQFPMPYPSHSCTLCQVMAQPQSLHCFYDLSFHTCIVLSLKLQCLEAGNLLHSVPGYFLPQRGFVLIGVFHTKSDGHPALHYYIWLICAEVRFHQNWEYWHFS